MEFQAVIRSKKDSNWKNSNDVGVIDGNGHFRYFGQIHYYANEMQFEIAPGIVSYSFAQSDFSTRAQMVAHVKRFVNRWVSVNQNFCNWQISSSDVRPEIIFCVDDKEPFFVDECWKKEEPKGANEMKMDGHRWIQTDFPGHSKTTADRGVTVDDYKRENVGEVRYDSKSYFYDIEGVSDDDFMWWACDAFDRDIDFVPDVKKDYNGYRVVVWLD